MQITQQPQTSKMKEPFSSKIQSWKSRLTSRYKKSDMTSSALTTFHPFPRLPAELRMKIWEYHIDRTPRTFELDYIMVNDQVSHSETQIRLFEGSCPKVLIPFPAGINQELRHEMSRRYQRVEFGGEFGSEGFGRQSYIAWINLEIDTIFVSHVTDHRFLLNFNQLALHNPWLTQIQHLAVSVERFFEMQYFSWYSVSAEIEKMRVNHLTPDWARFCIPESSHRFVDFIKDNCKKRDYNNWDLPIPNRSFQDRTCSWRDILLTTPKVKNLTIVHHSQEFRACDTGTLPGAVTLNFSYFSPENPLYHRRQQAHNYEARRQWMNNYLLKWKTFNASEPLSNVDAMEIRHVGLVRNGVEEDCIPHLTTPFEIQCMHRLHRKFRRFMTCPRYWTTPMLPHGITLEKSDKNGPFLKDASGKRLIYHLDVGTMSWKVGRPIPQVLREMVF